MLAGHFNVGTQAKRQSMFEESDVVKYTFLHHDFPVDARE
ncbi:MAG: hypothetical protein ACI8T1_001518 [Verrucomicrobiales bacterium]|jgi:hypothetical protein